MTTSEQKKKKAYQYCMAIAKSHYENFPVASNLLSKNLRLPISVVYAFARTADDFADEGDLTRHERLHLLDSYRDELVQIEISLKNHASQHSSNFFHLSNNVIFTALADVVYKFQVPIQLFYDLIEAFKQDVNVTRYQNFSEIINYCRLSANPVGRILLYLNKSATKQNLENSDAICTGLQLINFYQDIGQDIDENNRLYLPLDELEKYSVSVKELQKHDNNENTHALMNFQLQRTKKLYKSGRPLCAKLSGRFAIEIRMIYTGGQLILNKLEKNTRTIYQRPRLSRIDKFKILWGGFFSSD